MTAVPAKKHSPLYTIVVAFGGIVVAMLLLLGFFNYLHSLGFPTGAFAFLIILIGVFSLGSAGSHNYLASFFIILVGLFVFADSLGYLGSDQAPWLWPVFIVLFALILLTSLGQRRPA